MLFSIFIAAFLSIELSIANAAQPILPPTDFTAKTEAAMLSGTAVDEKTLKDQINAALDSAKINGIKSIHLGDLLMLIHFYGEIGYLHGNASINSSERVRLNTLLQSQPLSRIHVRVSLAMIRTYLKKRSDPRVSTFYWTALTEIPKIMSSSKENNTLIWSQLVEAWGNQGRYSEAKLTGENWIRKEAKAEFRADALAKMAMTALLFDQQKDFNIWAQQMLNLPISPLDLRKKLVSAQMFQLSGKYTECEQTLKDILPVRVGYGKRELLVVSLLSECLIDLKKNKEAIDILNQLIKIEPKIDDPTGFERETVFSTLTRKYILLGDFKTAYQKCLEMEKEVDVERTHSYLKTLAICKGLAPKNEPLPSRVTERFNRYRSFFQGLVGGSERLKSLYDFVNEPNSSPQIATYKDKLKKVMGPSNTVTLAISL